MNIPKGYKEIEGVTEVFVSDEEIVITGIPDEDDESHNCDYMGCGSLSHVIFRAKIEKCNKEYINKLEQEIALKSIILHALHLFPKAFINNSNEIILEPKNNVYFRLDDVKTEFDFKCKMFAWLSRPIAKGLSKYWSAKLLYSFNRLLNTNFTKEDMNIIYDRLGNDINRPLTIRFIESGYDLSLLQD